MRNRITLIDQISVIFRMNPIIESMKDIEQTDKMFSIKEQCNMLEAKDIFEAGATENLKTMALKLGANLEFLLPPFIATVSHCMGGTIAEVTPIFKQKMIVFTNLLANASTGKTPVYSFFKNALYKVEEFNNQEKSMITNCATVEGLVEFLKESPSVYSNFDESSTFYGALGRYSGGGNLALYSND